MIKKLVLLIFTFYHTAFYAIDLEKDKKQFEKYKTSVPVLLWKSTKVLLRSGIYMDSLAIQKLFIPQIDSIALTGPFTSYINGYFARLNKDTLKKNVKTGFTQNQLLQQIVNSSKAIQKIDEDAYPLLLPKICNSSKYDSIVQFYKANNVKVDANSEHAFIAFAGFSWVKVIDDVVLYELSEINMTRFQKTALKRTLLMMEAQFLARKGWHYLAEEKLTKAILELDINSPSQNNEVKNKVEQETLMYAALLHFLRAQERFQTKDPRLEKIALEDLKKAVKLSSKLKMRSEIIQIYLAMKQLETANRKGCIKTLKKIVQTIPTKTPEKLIAIQAIQGLKIKKDSEVLTTLIESSQYHTNGMILLKEFINTNVEDNELLKSSFKTNSKHPLHLLIKQFAKIEVRGFE
jgi:hypothetical protein